jgi:hypothetical protein
VKRREIPDGLADADPARRRAAADAAARILKKKGHDFDAVLVRMAAESQHPDDRQIAAEGLLEALQNIDDPAAVKMALAPVFARHLWDFNPKIRRDTAVALAWVATETELTPRNIWRLEALLRDPEAGAAAARALTNDAVRRGDFSRVAILLSNLLHLEVSYASPKAAGVAERELLTCADQKIDISPAVPCLEAAYASRCSGYEAGWALVRHYWNVGRKEELRRLVPLRDEYDVTISDTPRHGLRGKSVENWRLRARRCGYCGNPGVVCIYSDVSGDLVAKIIHAEFECSECGKFTTIDGELD